MEENSKKLDKKSIAKQLAKLEALADISENKEEFQMFFEKKYHLEFPNLEDCIYQKKKKLSDFDNKLLIAMRYNPKKINHIKKGDFRKEVTFF